MAKVTILDAPSKQRKRLDSNLAHGKKERRLSINSSMSKQGTVIQLYNQFYEILKLHYVVIS